MLHDILSLNATSLSGAGAPEDGEYNAAQNNLVLILQCFSFSSLPPGSV